jgi:hypothetical protein
MEPEKQAAVDKIKRIQEEVARIMYETTREFVAENEAEIKRRTRVKLEQLGATFMDGVSGGETVP